MLHEPPLPKIGGRLQETKFQLKDTEVLKVDLVSTKISIADGCVIEICAKRRNIT